MVKKKVKKKIISDGVRLTKANEIKSKKLSKGRMSRFLKRESKLAGHGYELKKLAKEANEYHRQFRTAWRGALEYARKCGEALNKAKPIPKHGNWQKWVEQNFEASYQTAAVYMRVAKEWDSKYLTAARAREPRLNSIKSVLEVLKNKSLNDDKEPKKIRDKPRTEKQEKELNKQREYFKHAIVEAVEDLYDFEFEILTEGFINYFWPIWYHQLRKTVIKLKKSNPYPPPEVRKKGDDEDIHPADEWFDWPPKLSKEDRERELRIIKKNLVQKSKERKRVKSKIIDK